MFSLGLCRTILNFHHVSGLGYPTRYFSRVTWRLFFPKHVFSHGYLQGVLRIFYSVFYLHCSFFSTHESINESGIPTGVEQGVTFTVASCIDPSLYGRGTWGLDVQVVSHKILKKHGADDFLA